MPAPGNDNFANATDITWNTTTAATLTGTTVAATSEGSEGAFNPSVWWKLTPSEDGAVRVDPTGSVTGTNIRVYSGSALGSLTLLLDPGALTPGWLEVTSGVTYHIRVGAPTGGEGVVALYVGMAGDPAPLATPVDFDLSTAVLFWGTVYSSGAITGVGDVAFFLWPDLVFDPDESYALEFDIDAGDPGDIGNATMWGYSQGTTGTYPGVESSSSYQDIGFVEAPGWDGTPVTLTLKMGPMRRAWPAAVAADEMRVMFEDYAPGQHTIAVRLVAGVAVSVPGGGGGGESDPPPSPSGTGRIREGSGTDTTVYPVPAAPAHLTSAPMRVTATQLPVPVLVAGRPT